MHPSITLKFKHGPFFNPHDLYKTMFKILKHFLFLLSVLGASIANALPAMPSSGSCAFLITQPVPLGITIFPYKGTGYNIMGTLSFSNSTTGVMNGVFVNVTYTNQDAPTYEHSAILKNVPFKVTAMTDANGFPGGYILEGEGGTSYKTISPNTSITVRIYVNVVPVNDGRSILMQLSSRNAGSGIGPGSGVCQF
jgi:hypothetical protein